MANSKGPDPFRDGAKYEEILGVEREKIREKIRKSAEPDSGSLLTSNDLFGDIIDDFEGATPHQAKPSAPPVQTDTAPGQDHPSTFSPNELVTGAPAGDVYSNLLHDAQLKSDVDRLETLESKSRVEMSERDADYGQYNLLERIATGGMAEVFRAKRKGVEGFEKIVAVKRILPHLSQNHEFVDMFIAEAKMVASLTHPNITQIFDLGVIDGSYYIAMEFVDGRDLRSILSKLRKRGMTLDEDLAALMAAKVGSALEYAHRRKDESGRELRIVHRDVSPQNILISKEGETKLVDFGIAKAAIKASHTDAGSLRGKLLYMSPEQAWGRPIDNRADIFSLGVVLFEMLTGETLFSGSSDMSILEQVRQAKVRLPSTVRPSVSEELDRVVGKALAKAPKQRYQDASEMLKDLDDYLRARPAVGPAELSQLLLSLFEEQPH